MIKINRARKIAAVGKFGASWDAVIAAIPLAVVNALSSRQIAELADSVWNSWGVSKAIAREEVLEEGAIYDPHRGRMVEISFSDVA